MSPDRDVLALLADLAAKSPTSAGWARTQYTRGALAIDIDHKAGVARLSMSDLPTLELALPEWMT